MFNEDFVKKINFFLYKKKHLIIYVIIGFLSLIFELSVRKFINNYISNNIFFLHISVIFGIIFAFYF